MPTYQYVCTECGTPLEVIQSFTDAAMTECPTCGGRLRKVFSAVGVVFKGSGFYRNDSRSEKTPVGATAKSGDAKSTSDGTTSGDSKSSSDSKTSTAKETGGSGSKGRGGSGSAASPSTSSGSGSSKSGSGSGSGSSSSSKSGAKKG